MTPPLFCFVIFLYIKFVTFVSTLNAYFLGNWSCAYPREDALHLWRDATTGDLPWPGMTFGLTSIAMFVWCNDQVGFRRGSKLMLPAVQNIDEMMD